MAELLATSRLLSLTGSGGVGKTRLALRLAANLAGRFPSGVWLIDLAALTTADLVAQTIATVVGVRESPQRSAREALLDHFRQGEPLLILDTCEHLIDACAELVHDLLRGAPAMRIVATSREPLGVPGEIVYRVPSLSLPEQVAALSSDALMHSEATQLFIERAMAIAPAFTASETGSGAIARICRRLDGIPLAIELAAARVAVLSLEQIEARLQDRFRLLTGGPRTAVARQRTLEATVEWSYQLLSEGERSVLSRVSIFPASWTLEAAEAICGGDGINPEDVLESVARLVSKSLIAVESDVAGGRRYRLLETVRQYARGRLMDAGDADRFRRRHFEFFWNEFRGAQPILRGPGQVPCLNRLVKEQENLRAALEWALDSVTHSEEGVELAGALFWFWTKRGLFEEGKSWLTRAVALQASAEFTGRALIGLAHMHYFQGRHVATADVATRALSLGRDAGDARVVQFSLFMQALAAFEAGDYDVAQVRALEAREAADACPAVDLGGPLMILANLAIVVGDLDRAQHLFDESIAVLRQAGELWGLGILLSIAGGLRIVRGDFDQARAQALEALSLCEQLEDPRGLAWSLEVFAGLLAAGGFADGAARLWGASDGLLETAGGSLVPTIGWIRDRYIDPVRASLGDGSFRALCAEGRAMRPIQAAAFAREQTFLLV